MTKNEPSTVIADAITAPEGAAKTEGHKKRIPLIWIPATLSIGLLIAAVYLGGRIVTAQKSARPAVVKPLQTESQGVARKPAPPQIVPSVQEKVAEVSVAAEKVENYANNAVPLITPQAGERYIQLAALDAEATKRFVQRLRSEKLEPHVAPGPRPELMRVLIGPFDNIETLNEKKAQLQTEGMDTFVRVY